MTSDPTGSMGEARDDSDPSAPPSEPGREEMDADAASLGDFSDPPPPPSAGGRDAMTDGQSSDTADDPDSRSR